MTAVSKRRAAALVGALLARGAARADDVSGMGCFKMAPGPAAAAPATASGGPAATAFAQSMESMMKGMDAKPTGNPDVDVVDMMMSHHQGAIDMAKAGLRYGREPVPRKLAGEIVEAPAVETAEMQAWKTQHGR